MEKFKTSKKTESIIGTYYEVRDYLAANPNVVQTHIDYLNNSLICDAAKNNYPGIKIEPTRKSIVSNGIKKYDAIRTKEDEKIWLDVFGHKFVKKSKND